MQKLQLPIPSPEAQQASHALIELIAQQIDADNGWISFERYMETALYAPQLGYYTGGSAKLGSAGDFITAPEISSLFGSTIAHFAQNILSQTAPNIMEFGAGTGKLAVDILTEMQALGCLPERYYIVELSVELRQRQQQLLKPLQAFCQIEWLQNMPNSFSGLVIGNEVLDAMPVKIVTKTANGWQEMGVQLSEQTQQHNGIFSWQPRPIDDAQVLQQINTQIPHQDALPPDYITEIHPIASGFMRSIADMLKAEKSGAALFFDYGFPAAEYYLPERRQGTIMCHYRHHSHTDPFYLPGLQDITAHVDFSQMAHVANDAGIDVLHYNSQAAFLLHAGISEIILRTSPSDVLHYLPQASALQKLVSPAEMGELFKVLVLGKNVELPSKLTQQSRLHRL